MKNKMPKKKEIVTPWICNEVVNEVSTNLSHIIVETCHIIW
jgi:hypothetical protein